MALSVGDILDDRYVLLQRLGEGGQGEVWKALDRLPPNRNVALKLIELERTSPSDLERLRREAAALHELAHPSLVPCRRAFEELSRKLFGLVLDYVDGSTVEDVLADGRFTEANRKWVLAHLASVLWYLHERGLVHRDLKPANVLLGMEFWRAPDRPENLKLIDLGIAAVEGNPRPVTGPGRVIGTAPYMAPEVIDPESFRAPIAGPTRDVFAFGVMGWELLAGRHPTGLEEGDLRAYAGAYRAALRGTLPWPQGSVRGAWGQILRSCFALRAADRPPSGREIAEAVQGLKTAVREDATARHAPVESRTETSARTETAPRWAPPAVPPTAPGAPSPAAMAPPERVITPPASVVPVREKKGSGWLIYVLVGAALAVVVMLLVPRLISSTNETAPNVGTPAPSARSDVVPAPTHSSRPAPAPVESPTAPRRTAPKKTPRDTLFGAACCAETDCEISESTETLLTNQDKYAGDGQCACTSGTKILGCCDGKPPAGQTWSLRLSNVMENDPTGKTPLQAFPGYSDAEVCVKRSIDPAASWGCKSLKAASAGGVAIGVQATTLDLETGGIDIRIYQDASYATLVASRTRAIPRGTKLGLGTLCIGLMYIKGFSSAVLRDPSVAFFLDPVP